MNQPRTRGQQRGAAPGAPATGRAVTAGPPAGAREDNAWMFGAQDAGFAVTCGLTGLRLRAAGALPLPSGDASEVA